MAVRSSQFVTTIREAWNQLHGVFCIYKPVRLSSQRVRFLVLNNIVRDINQLEPQKPREYVNIEPCIRELESGGTTVSYTVSKTINLADLPAVSGPPIQHDDIRLGWAHSLGWRSSGVMVFGLNNGNRKLRRLVESRPISVYQVKGQFGIATDNGWDDGKVFEKTVNPYLTRFQVDRFIASIQASNQRNIFHYCGVDPTSQTAYELASKGLLRPAVNGPPVIYGIKCILFEPPNFTLEIHCINESEKYLSTLVHEMGLALKTTAVCCQIRCIRYGPFDVDDSLLRRHWSLEHLPLHMLHCAEKLASLPEFTPNLTNVTNPKTEDAHAGHNRKL